MSTALSDHVHMTKSGTIQTLRSMDFFFLFLMYVKSSKVRSCYRISILSNPADQKKIITSKNNNKIAGKWDC